LNYNNTIILKFKLIILFHNIYIVSNV
jgi:hypothetical protein